MGELKKSILNFHTFSLFENNFQYSYVSNAKKNKKFLKIIMA